MFDMSNELHALVRFAEADERVFAICLCGYQTSLCLDAVNAANIWARHLLDDGQEATEEGE